MVAVTYGAARGAAANKAAPRKPLLGRVMDALIESRMQQARREIARHAHLFPSRWDEAGDRLVRTGQANLPSGGR